jgi:hypothetical protein
MVTLSGTRGSDDGTMTRRGIAALRLYRGIRVCVASPDPTERVNNRLWSRSHPRLLYQVLEVMFEYCPWGMSDGQSGGVIRDGAGGGMSGGPAPSRSVGHNQSVTGLTVPRDSWALANPETPGRPKVSRQLIDAFKEEGCWHRHVSPGLTVGRAVRGPGRYPDR